MTLHPQNTAFLISDQLDSLITVSVLIWLQAECSQRCFTLSNTSLIKQENTSIKYSREHLDSICVVVYQVTLESEQLLWVAHSLDNLLQALPDVCLYLRFVEFLWAQFQVQLNETLAEILLRAHSGF